MVLTITSLPISGVGAAALSGSPTSLLMLVVASWTILMAGVAVRTMIPKEEK